MLRIEILMIIMLASYMFDSCKSTPIYRETHIFDTVIVVRPPPIDVTLSAAKEGDSVVKAESIRGKDTIVRVRYYPKLNTITVFAQPDTVRTTYRDTTVIWREGKTQESGVGWWWFVMAVALLAVGWAGTRWFKLKFGI